MKATELMIGDWVMYHNTPRQVVYINDRRLRELHNNEVGFTHDEDEWIAAHNASPIPLTPEILEKNGWEKSIGENPVEVWAIGKGVYLHKTDNGYKLREGAEFNVPSIHDVHELQHALRLCGLNDLADNFKI